ncbi:MAG: hypothetical protein ACK2T7_09665 [Anaerolineales bacterium]
MSSQWKYVYKIGAVSAILFVVYSLVTIFIQFFVGGMPGSALEAYQLLHENLLTGLLRLDALTILVIPLYFPIFLAIYVALKDGEPGMAAFAALLVFAGTTLFLATPSAFPLVRLSEQYYAASSAVEQERLLAVGEALIASDMWHASGAAVGGILQLVAGLVFAILMLRGDRFGRWTAILGTITFGIDLLHKMALIFSPSLAMVLMFGMTFYLIWFPLLSRDLFRLAREE